MSQIDAARNRSSALQDPKPGDRLLEQRAAFVFGDALSATAFDRLPFHEAYEFDVGAAGQINMRERAGEVVGRRFDKSSTVGNFATQNFAIKVLLGAEAVIEHPLVDPRATGDRVHPRTGEAFG